MGLMSNRVLQSPHLALRVLLVGRYPLRRRTVVRATVVGRSAIQAIAFAVIGAALLVAGWAIYEQTWSATQQADRGCGVTACVESAPNPVFLPLFLGGVVLLIVAGLLGA